jgi:7-cyano-7-deazaguanine synthase
MCTLFGFCSNKDGKIDSEKVINGVNNLDLRGRDAFGALFWFKDGSLRRYATTSHLELINLTKVHLPHLRAGLFNGRAIPASERVHGSINIKRDSQPFEYNGFGVIHNGTISNDAALREVAGTTESPVDTAVMPQLFNVYYSLTPTQIFEMVEGSYAMAVLDTHGEKLHLTTNFMPLYVESINAVVYLASDPIQLPLGTQLSYYTVVTWDMKTNTLTPSFLKNKLDTKKVVVVTSGGLDSVTTARLYQVLGFNTTMVHYKYGQNAQAVEDYATQKISERLGIPLLTVDVKSLFENTKPSILLSGKKVDPSLRHLDMESTLSYVGARNLIFSSITMGVAERLGAGTIALGLNLDDSTYPDNNITFLRELTKVGSTCLDWYEQIAVKAPFVHLTKKEIIEVGIAINTPFDLQVSCYNPSVKKNIIYSCGGCGCDKLREYSFKALGIIDPVPYEDQVPDWTGCKSLEELYPNYDAGKTTSIMTPETIPYMKYLYL